jgi:hypothetical protein
VIRHTRASLWFGVRAMVIRMPASGFRSAENHSADRPHHHCRGFQIEAAIVADRECCLTMEGAVICNNRIAATLGRRGTSPRRPDGEFTMVPAQHTDHKTVMLLSEGALPPAIKTGPK